MKRISEVASSLISTDRLRHRCMQSIEEIAESVLAEHPKRARSLMEKTSSYLVHLDRGSKVLAVAHMDHVWQEQFFQKVTQKGKSIYWFSPVLDDRIGVYTILDLLPLLNINVDVLLTDDEEKCQSTASSFDPKELGKDYNWIVSFDRAGNDVVTYQKDSSAWLTALDKTGFHTGWGSYSCIASLDKLDCCGVNIGTGLEAGHGPGSYIKVEGYLKNLARFTFFYRKYKDQLFKEDRTPSERIGGKTRFFGYDGWGEGSGWWNNRRELEGNNHVSVTPSPIPLHLNQALSEDEADIIAQIRRTEGACWKGAYVDEDSRLKDLPF